MISRILNRNLLAVFTVSVLLANVPAANSAEVLYNGIVLPSPWPPRLADFPTTVDKDPAIPPYLALPPQVPSYGRAAPR